MSIEQYEINYDDGQPRQQRIPDNAPPPTTAAQNHFPSKKPFKLPESVKAGLFILAGGGIFLISEAVLPEGDRLTDLIGISETRMEIMRVRMEKQADAEVQVYVASAQSVAQQNNERVHALLEGELQNYQATYGMANIYAQETARMQSALMQTDLQVARSAQSSDTAVVNLTRLWSRIRDGIEPGSGAAARAYSDSIRDEMYDELNAATHKGETINVEGWDIDLAKPEEVQARFEQFQLAPMPAPPKIGLTLPAKTSGGK